MGARKCTTIGSQKPQMDDDGRPSDLICLYPGPDYASVSPNGRLLTVYTDGGNGVKILDVALITEIEG